MINFILTEMTFLRYFIPLIIEGNKRNIISNVFVGQSGKYNCPRKHANQILELAHKYKFNAIDIKKMKESQSVNISIEACGIQHSSKDSKKIVLTYQNDFSNRLSIDGEKYYFKFLDAVDHVIMPSLFFAKYHDCISDKNLYLGSPKYDIDLNRSEIIKKYNLKNDKNVLVLFPRNRDRNKVNVKEIYSVLKDLGYNIIVKTRGKDRVSDEILRGDHYFEDFSWYPHTSMELISVSDFVVNFGSTANKECVMLRKPMVNFDVKPIGVNFGNNGLKFLNEYDYCINILPEEYSKEKALESFGIIASKDYNSEFDKSIKSHLFDFNSSKKIIDFLLEKGLTKMKEEKKIKYIDGRPIPLYKVSGRAELLDLAEKGAISWEFGAFTENNNLDPHCIGNSWESEYLNRPDKIQSSYQAFDVYEKYCKTINKSVDIDANSKIIEFGCAMGRNLVIGHNKYGCKVFGIDICQEVIDKCSKMFKSYGEFHKVNMRNEKGLDFLRKFDDNTFDLGISDCFLMCIAAGDFKKKLLSEMMRVCKGIWIQEKKGETQYEYKIMNSVQSGESLVNEYNEKRLVQVESLPDDEESVEILKDNVMYVKNRPFAWNNNAQGSYFYVYRK